VVGWIGLIGTIRTSLYAGAIAPAIALLVVAIRRMPARRDHLTFVQDGHSDSP
jgi:hypothetical protein